VLVGGGLLVANTEDWRKAILRVDALLGRGWACPKA